MSKNTNTWSKPPQQSPEQRIIDFVKKEVSSNNLLGLPDDELLNMASIIATCGSRKEVFDWTETLMMGDAFSAEIVKRREDWGPPFEGETVRRVVGGGAQPATLAEALNTSALPALASSTAQRGSQGKVMKATAKKGTGKKGRAGGTQKLSQAKANAAASSALKPGQFECGCFATIHKFRGNCCNCGRIICEQEADDECYSCNMETSRCVAYEIKVQEGLLSEAALQEDRADYEKALSKRDQLLQYAENRAKRTTVIDDQSVSAAYMTKDAWMTKEEREDVDKAAAAAERKRIMEARHRATGAYQVHIDIVNENISLGATELSLPDDKDSASPRPGTLPSTSNPNECASPSEESSEDGDSDADPAVDTTRAVPLPTLLGKIWYNPDGDGELSQGKEGVSSMTSNPWSSGVNEGGTDKNAPVITVKQKINRSEAVSRRVQQDYFADDVEYYAEELQRDQRLAAKNREFDGTLAQAGVTDDGYSSADDITEEVRATDPSSSTGDIARNAATGSPFEPSTVMRLNDSGMCLSMHQPWASLLVSGIMRHEGRTWPTDFRGRLWIHAASAQPQNIAETEAHYMKFLLPGQEPPKHYPTRVLLGYVYVVDCMDREKYEATFPEEERQGGSPYTFICSEPAQLLFPLPMEGNHKIFKLEHKVHSAAKKQLREIS